MTFDLVFLDFFSMTFFYLKYLRFSLKKEEEKKKTVLDLVFFDFFSKNVLLEYFFHIIFRQYLFTLFFI